MNVGLLLDMAVEADRDRIVVGPNASGWTAAELRTRAAGLAGQVLTEGLRHVGLVALNGDVVPLGLFGAAYAGVPFAPLNFRLPDAQLRTLAARLSPALIIADTDQAGRLADIPEITVRTTDDVLGSPVGLEVDLPWVDPDEIAVLLFTSGTTGQPKAAVLRHQHLASYVLSSVELHGSDPAEAQLVAVPSYHIAGITSVLSNVYGGRRITYLDAFDPDRWVRLVEAERITHAMVVPTMLGRVLDSAEAAGRDLSSIRHLSYGGGRMPLQVIERAMKALPEVAFVNAYGLTETSSTISVLGPEDHREAARSTDPQVRARLGSVGRPLPSVEVEIRDADGAPVPAGQTGEVHVRGPQVAGEYVGGSLVDADGWFPTRDAGVVDDDGFLFLHGRLDDVIVRGAENLSPGEIEDCLSEHPAVAEAAVVGIPDVEWGEAVAAAVVLRPGALTSAEELHQWVRIRLRSTKAPTTVRFVDELPSNETGKLLRRVLRETLSSAAERPSVALGPRPAR